MHKIQIYTDGSCTGNPGPGGWGVYIVNASQSWRLHGSEAHTTNNRMELVAAIKALEHLPSLIDSQQLANSAFDIYTDSQYLQRGITTWSKKWQANNWKSSSRVPVKNVDLWRALIALTAAYRADWHWLRGHNNDLNNDIADHLAKLGMQQAMKHLSLQALAE